MKAEDIKIGMKVRYHPIIGREPDTKLYTVISIGKESEGKASKKGRISLYQRGHGTKNLVTLKMNEVDALPEEKRVHIPEVLVPVYEDGVILRRYKLEEVRANSMKC